MKAINDHGLFNLNDFLPKKPTDVELKVLTEMFEASVDGEAYDPDRWSNYFRPAGMAARTGDPNVAASANATATSQSAPVSRDEDDDIPFKSNEEVSQAAAPAPRPTPAPAAPAAGGGAQDILAMIRARQGQ
jgi:hypothetical protein